MVQYLVETLVCQGAAARKLCWDSGVGVDFKPVKVSGLEQEDNDYGKSIDSGNFIGMMCEGCINGAGTIVTQAKAKAALLK